LSSDDEDDATKSSLLLRLETVLRLVLATESTSCYISNQITPYYIDHSSFIPIQYHNSTKQEEAVHFLDKRRPTETRKNKQFNYQFALREQGSENADTNNGTFNANVSISQ
jgi:hypothetical protein